jgi:hypothetical protein
MNKKIELFENVKYSIVKSWNSDNGITDISIFEVNEWNELLEISLVFENAVFGLNNTSNIGYIGTLRDYRNSAYFLYYSNFCRYQGFTKLEHIIGTKQDLHEVIFKYVENNEIVTYNSLRYWITDNFDELIEHHDNLKND